MFRHLSLAEQQERRRQGLCYNCDEPYVRGHQCQRLFYLECTDFVDGPDTEPPLLARPPQQRPYKRRRSLRPFPSMPSLGFVWRTLNASP